MIAAGTAPTGCAGSLCSIVDNPGNARNHPEARPSPGQARPSPGQARPSPGQARPLPGEDAVWDALRGVVDPELGDDIVSLHMVRSLKREGGVVEVEIALTVASCPLRTRLGDDARRRVLALPGVEEVRITTGVMEQNERAAL
ncbi:MAG: iron-sulfur cluster assembly protein, partial [Actinomycetota bacterium]|nr:iron-sulfur cluster assembly protein [Actinomycetota bacterium]